MGLIRSFADKLITLDDGLDALNRRISRKIECANLSIRFNDRVLVSDRTVRLYATIGGLAALAACKAGDDGQDHKTLAATKSAAPAVSIDTLPVVNANGDTLYGYVWPDVKDDVTPVDSTPALQR